MVVSGNAHHDEKAPDVDLLALIETHQIGHLRRYTKGQVLFWQGGPVENVFVVKSGAIKVSSVLEDGRTYTYDVLGPGELTGAEAFLLGNDHEALAEALEATEVFTITPGEFEHLLATDAHFSRFVMKRLAQDVSLLAGKVRDFGFLDVQQRVKSNLIKIANEHGIVTDKGIQINLDITHEEISEMVAANRTTITACLSELRRQGYLWKEGKRFFIIPPDQIEILDNLEQAVADGSEDEAKRYALEAKSKNINSVKAFEALTGGMRQVDRLYARSKMDVSDVILAAFAMKAALPIIEGEIEKTYRQVDYLGAIVIGTVYGDIHDIGRTMVAMLLKARGFHVIDLGANVPADQFVAAIKSYKPQILAMSMLMTTTAQEPPKVMHALAEEGLRERVKVMIGGSAVTQKLSEDIGADGYEPSAHRAVELAWRLMNLHSSG